jgi:hypothetical protein
LSAEYRAWDVGRTIGWRTSAKFQAEPAGRALESVIAAAEGVLGQYSDLVTVVD